MKKTLLVAATMAAGLSFAEGIASANVVGYQNFEVDSLGFAEVGAAFAPVNEDGKWVCESTVFGSEVSKGDTVYFLNETAWDMDDYAFLGYTKDGDPAGWEYVEHDPLTGKPITTKIASFELKKGDQIYFNPNDAVSGLTVAGQVENINDSASWVLPEGETSGTIMNPYPIDTKLSEIESFAEVGDQLYVFNTTAWNFDIYILCPTCWEFSTMNLLTGDMVSSKASDVSKVVMKASTGGYYIANDKNGRTWTVSLSK